MKFEKIADIFSLFLLLIYILLIILSSVLKVKSFIIIECIVLDLLLISFIINSIIFRYKSKGQMSTMLEVGCGIFSIIFSSLYYLGIIKNHLILIIPVFMIAIYFYSFIIKRN